MQNTKELILREALRRFAREGYEAVSVRDIAGALGITQSALYKHYAGKRDIFDSIVRRMEARDAERAREYAMPEAEFSRGREGYGGIAPEALAEYTMAQFLYWTEDDLAADFRRMLTLEQYRSPEMSALYQQYLSGGVTGYLEDIFRESAAAGSAARRRALEFYAPVYMLLNLYDAAQDKQAITAQAREHIEGFFGEAQH